jgi:hypothetical protein
MEAKLVLSLLPRGVGTESFTVVGPGMGPVGLTFTRETAEMGALVVAAGSGTDS